jgi:uncharacterized protein
VLLVLDHSPLSVEYQLTCDLRWRPKQVSLDVLGPAGHSQLRLFGDGLGGWSDSNGAPLPALDGCIDIDISITPLTNTLPIRRLALDPGQHADLRVVYVSIPELTSRAVEQRYACGSRSTQKSIYRYQSGSFDAELSVDCCGLVLDYPGVWQRIPTVTHDPERAADD